MRFVPVPSLRTLAVAPDDWQIRRKTSRYMEGRLTAMSEIVNGITLTIRAVYGKQALKSIL